VARRASEPPPLALADLLQLVLVASPGAARLRLEQIHCHGGGLQAGFCPGLPRGAVAGQGLHPGGREGSLPLTNILLVGWAALSAFC